MTISIESAARNAFCDELCASVSVVPYEASVAAEAISIANSFEVRIRTMASTPPKAIVGEFHGDDR